MMKKYTYYLILSFFFIFLKVDADPIISFFFKSVHEKMSTVKTPEAINKHCFSYIVTYTPVAGIIATYNGYVSISDYNGEITFPRRHQKPSVTILITKELTPIFMFARTVHHWELVPGAPAALYTIERINDETIPEKSLWSTTHIDLPEDNKIHPATIIIAADPENVIIEEGISPTIESPNLTLPTIIINKGMEFVPRTIENLDIRFLFRPTGSKNQKESLRLITHTLN